MDRLRRCEVRDQFGHRCNRHVNHVVEVANSKTGLSLPDGENDDHGAFGREFGDEKMQPQPALPVLGNRPGKRRGWVRAA